MSHYTNKSQATVHDKNGLPVYGLDKELAKKQAGKHDPQKEKEVRQWIEAVTGTKFSSNDFQESLKDGVLLCKLANKIKPGIVKTINSGKMPFMCMENIGYFLKAAAELGLDTHNTFMSVDLYEGKNIPLVIMALYSFGSVVQKRVGYNLPTLGLKISDKKEIEFTERQLRQANAEVGQQFGAASVKHDTGRSISKEVVKVNNTGDSRVFSQQTGGSVKHDTGRSISHEVVKVNNTGDSRVFSQQTGGSIKHDTGRSISNEVVKIKPSTSTSSKSSSGSNLDELEKLGNLRDKGIITEREFQLKKKQLLGL
ncbi:hypothetical protein NAEGRDRAFT_76225 [Naegleria gruberi]|uniref:Uncharacterized protein AM1a n=1 Tax=Naegleria gruberi TaxID=5762 RepID=D2W495_NAEGR|nr:uncharacterized protein NAEGRDRAFT_76225 [Naegleria gruberi]EFC36106.1 hypothetical protein NAEGRDRAFT_76225 [Naegleria gruberi]|eukprot:XP_002668850.1 hypothetical protein NAEGRDRAFT_76225 [Naegleria gruberi strain NEG-M]